MTGLFKLLSVIRVKCSNVTIYSVLHYVHVAGLKRLNRLVNERGEFIQRINILRIRCSIISAAHWLTGICHGIIRRGIIGWVSRHEAQVWIKYTFTWDNIKVTICLLLNLFDCIVEVVAAIQVFCCGGTFLLLCSERDGKCDSLW